MLDKEKIIRNFSRSANSYDQHALLQKKLADELLESIGKGEASRILDIGCGTGYLTNKLAEAFPQAEVIGIDIAPGMIAVANQKYRSENLRFAVGDGEGLPFDRGSFDLIVSNAALQWMRAEKAIKEVVRVVRSQSCFIFKTFGPETLRELRASGFKVNEFIAKDEYGDLLKDKFPKISTGSEKIKAYFKTVKELMAHLKEIGANTTDGVQLTNINVMAAIRKYNEKYKSNSGISVTYEIISGIAYT